TGLEPNHEGILLLILPACPSIIAHRPSPGQSSVRERKPEKAGMPASNRALDQPSNAPGVDHRPCGVLSYMLRVTLSVLPARWPRGFMDHRLPTFCSEVPPGAPCFDQ